MEQELRRKAPRRHFDGRAGVLYRGRMAITNCSQLGEGGALISSENLLEGIQKGDALVITLFLPNIGGMVGTAHCVYLTDHGKIGLQFEELDMTFKVRIREFVSRRKKVEKKTK